MNIVKIKTLAKERKGMSLPELESAVGFGNSTISKWRNSSPTVSKLQTVANYLGVGIAELIDENAPAGSISESVDEKTKNRINRITAIISNLSDEQLSRLEDQLLTILSER